MATIYINGVDKTSEMNDYVFSFALNDIPKLSLTMTMSLSLNDTVKLVEGSKTLFNGFINSDPVVDYDTNQNTALALGNLSKLSNKRSNERRNWTNSNINIIVPAIIGDTFTINSVDSFSPISVTDEYASPLLTITKLAMACRGDIVTPLKVNNHVISSYDFWVDEVSDEFYFKTHRGSLTSVASYTINTEIWNVKNVPSEQSEIINSVIVTGAGDGINQIVRHSSNLYAPIQNNLASSGNLTIQLTDDDYEGYLIAKNTYLESIPSGTGVKIKINDEIMGISSSNDTNKTVDVLATDRGLDSTSLQAHSIGDYIYGGSVLAHGLRQKTYYDRSTIDSDTAFEIASSAVYELSMDKTTLTFNIDNVDDFWLGDVITLDGTDYRVLSIDTGLTVGFYTVSVGYISRGQISQYEAITMKLTDGSVYAQGATNIYSVQDTDNCDASHPLDIKFYVPPEAVRINHVKLNFTLENFRAHSTGAASGGSDTVTSTTDGSSTPTSSNFASHNHDIDSNIRVSRYDTTQSGTFEPYVFTVQKMDSSSSGTSTTTSDVLLWVNTTLNPIVNKDIVIDTLSGTVGAISSEASHSHTVSISGHNHDVSILDHTHDITYGIYEEPLTSPSVTVTANGNTVGTYTAAQNDIDVGAWITSSGWHTIRFTPNKRMRINANVYIQVYIESK